MNVIEHYDKLIDENNDPVHDPDPIKEYMNKWDGQIFIDSMGIDKTKSVLEIGVGTGRLAIKTAPLCRSFLGIDISPKTIDRANRNLSKYQNIELVCADFMIYDFTVFFDVIYSSLTFMHIKDKQNCIDKVFSLLNSNGVFVLSIDKNTDKFIDMGTYKIETYPDTFLKTQSFINKSGFNRIKSIETEFAYIFIAVKS